LRARRCWAPCSASAGRGALLTVAYCVGLGLPFVAVAVAYRRALGAFAWVKQHYVWVMRTGGGLLIALGVLLLTGVWDSIMSDTQSWAQSFNVGI
jgi:cytochrome c-type biogenesis protein